MANHRRFRFSMGRLMIDLGLFALPLGVLRLGFRQSTIDATEVLAQLFGAAWFVFTMEVSYACFLLPEVIQPWRQRRAKSQELEPIPDERQHPLD